MKINKLLVILTFFFILKVSNAQVAIIANKSVKETGITSDLTKDIYTLDQQRWSNGDDIKVYDIKANNSSKETFYKFIGETPLKLKKIWLRAKLSGEGTPPKALATDNDVLNAVATTSGAIGYIDASKVTKKVKVLKTIK